MERNLTMIGEGRGGRRGASAFSGGSPRDGSLCAFANFMLVALLSSIPRYQVWRLIPTTQEQGQFLARLQEDTDGELDFWTDVSRIPGHPVDIMVRPRSQDDLRMLLTSKQITFDIMIKDVGNLVAEQMLEIEERRQTRNVEPTLANFDYYTYHTYHEIQQWVADIVSENSDIMTPILYGYSFEGREINGYRIRGTGSTAHHPPAVWFEGGIHAREWISPATVMGFTQELIDSYRSNDPLVTAMFDNIDWYMVPSLNVDGYSHTWTNDRMWRKTRSLNDGSACVGTDPNRNWPFEWGGSGASPFACSDTYRGSAPLSESEVHSVVNFCRQKKLEGQDFLVFIDWHSYSQVMIAPWSYLVSDPRTVDYDDQMVFAKAVADAIFAVYGTVYEYGAGAEMLYTASGSSKDTGYADFVPSGPNTNGGLDIKYSYTVELRDTGEYGFLLPEIQIQPTIEETTAGVRAMGDHLLNELGVPY